MNATAKCSNLPSLCQVRRSQEDIRIAIAEMALLTVGISAPAVPVVDYRAGVGVPK